MADFDLVTHKRNGKGQINQENHYIRKVVQGQVQYERPPKSGIWFYENGERVNAEAKADVDQIAAEITAQASEVTAKTVPGQPSQANLNSKK